MSSVTLRSPGLCRCDAEGSGLVGRSLSMHSGQVPRSRDQLYFCCPEENDDSGHDRDGRGTSLHVWPPPPIPPAGR